MIDRAVINRGEIPRRILHEISRGGVNGETFRNQLHQHAEPLVFFLIHFARARCEEENRFRFDFVRPHAHPPEPFAPFFRMHRVFHQRPWLVGAGKRTHVCIRNNHAIDRLGGMAAEPVHDI